MKKIIGVILGILVIVGLYSYIVFKPANTGINFVTQRLDFMGEDHIKEVKKNKEKQILNDKVGLDFNFNNDKVYQVNNSENNFLILEYKNEILSTKDKEKFGDYLSDKSKKMNIKTPDFKDYTKIQKQIKTLKNDIAKSTNLRNDFDFNINNNFIIIKFKGSTKTLDRIVRYLR